jgi:hypothetical protein
MTSSDYGLYLFIGIGFIWIAGVSCFVLDMILKPKVVPKKVYKKPVYQQKEEDSFVIIDDVSFPI